MLLRSSLKMPRSPKASLAAKFFIQGDKHRDVKRWSEAAESYQQGLVYAPGSFAIWVQLGHMLKESNDLLGAENAYLKSLGLKQTDHDLHVQLGHLYSQMTKHDKAREHYTRAVALGSNDPIALKSSSNQPIALRSTDLVPKPPTEEIDKSEIFFREGDSHRDKRQWSEAAEAYQKGLAQSPASFGIWVQLGHVLKEMGLFERAQAAYLRALELRYTDGDLSVQLGHLYALMGDSVRASDHYARSIGLGMRDQHALSFLARQPNHDRSLKLVLNRLINNADFRADIFDAPDVGLSFAQFILRYAPSPSQVAKSRL